MPPVPYVRSVVLLMVAAAASSQASPPVELTVSPGGDVHLASGKAEIAHIGPALFEAGWNGAGYAPGSPRDFRPGIYRGKIKATGGVVESELHASDISNGVSLNYALTPKAALALHSLHINISLPERELAGQKYVCDGVEGVLAEKSNALQVFAKRIRKLSLFTKSAGEIQFEFSTPVHVLLQDDRRWAPTFSVRIGEPRDPQQPVTAGVPVQMAFSLVRPAALKTVYDAPVILAASPEWIPLEYTPEVEPGSALDFSKQGHLDAPAGKHGRVVACKDGTFAFEKSPGTPRRFYGINFCNTAQYLGHDQAERLADRLARIGYNAIRVHHYESNLVVGKNETVTLRPDRIEQFDYFFAELKKRGLYVTTDLYVSRPVLAREIWDGAEGRIEMDDFKVAVMVNEKALENWKAFARNLLTHRNPYTGLTYAEDPALAWLSMINEGNVGNFLGRIRSPRLREECQQKWNDFLKSRYGSTEALRKAWGRDPGGDLAAGSVPLVTIPWSPENTQTSRDAALFCTSLDLTIVARMKKFLREELHCEALVTNMNAWTNPQSNQAARAAYDYVDDHFYVDHPHFLERPWSLPSSCPNTNPIADGAPGGCACCFVRLFDRPFTISEYNYSGPGRYRSVGGILTGGLGAIQDCGALWRFAFSHTRDNLFQPARADYFDIGADPLNQIAERAAICLYLRGDMRPAPHKVAIGLNANELLSGQASCRRISPSWTSLAWLTRVGTGLADDHPIAADLVLPGEKAPIKASGKLLKQDPYAADAGQKILNAMRSAGWLEGNVTDLNSKRLQSETKELLIDGPRGVMVLDTARTAGGCGPEGETIRTGAATVTIDRSFATVWASSLDGKPIASSHRLLLCHLTDLQNTGAEFGERERRTLYAWGRLPHLIQAGEATVRLRLDRPERAAVYAISTSGKRLERITAHVESGELVLRLKVAGPDGNARLAYEVVVE